MHPNVTFGGGATASTMSFTVLALMFLVIPLVLALPRKYAIAPFLLFVFLTPIEQQFYVGGLHFFAQRIVILCGCLRLFWAKAPAGGSIFGGGINRIDKVFLWWAIARATAFTLRFHDGGALANQIGFIWDTVGGYFLVRYLIQDEDDIRRTAKVLAVIAVVMAGCMVYEQRTLVNPFALLMGGKVHPDVRYGRVRCRGIFAQQILASAFGGTLVPLFCWLWKGGKSKIGAIAGLTASSLITWTASSSTGISAYLMGAGVLCMWPIRRHMRVVRWSIVAAILGLTMMMKAPLWYIMARVDFVGGSTGWDRAYLVDQFVRHFTDWFLLGTDSAVWGDFTWDLCNQFVAEGSQGGIVAFVLFIALVALCFQRIGIARKAAEGDLRREKMLWMLGALVAAHVAGFFGISYFDQSKVWWFATLAMISAATTGVKPAPAIKRIPEPEWNRWEADAPLAER